MGMPIVIQNNSDGTIAGVSKDNQLKVLSESLALQHYVSRTFQNTYQVIGTVTPAAATRTVLHIKNTDPDRELAISYIRLQTVDLAGGTALPSATNYFQLGFDQTVSSGGTAGTNVNVNVASGKVASVTSTYNNPTVAGTFVEIDRWYPASDGDMAIFNKEGSVLLGLGNTFSIRFVSDHTSGTCYARTTFMMLDAD